MCSFAVIMLALPIHFSIVELKRRTCMHPYDKEDCAMNGNEVAPVTLKCAHARKWIGTLSLKLNSLLGYSKYGGFYTMAVSSQNDGSGFIDVTSTFERLLDDSFWPRYYE